MEKVLECLFRTVIEVFKISAFSKEELEFILSFATSLRKKAEERLKDT